MIADDHRVVRDGLRYLLSQEPEIDVVGEAGDGGQALHVILTKLDLRDRVQAAIFAIRHQGPARDHPA